MDPIELAQLSNVVSSGEATQDWLERASRECLEDFLKAKSTADLIYRTTVRAPSAIDEAKRTVRKIVSVEKMDRMGDVIQLKPHRKFGGSGMNSDDVVRARGPYLWSHDAKLLKIADILKVYSTTVVIEGKRYNAMGQVIQYLEEDLNPFSEVVWRLEQAGKMPSSSIGFKPLGALWIGSSIEEGGESFTAEELGVRAPWGMRYISSELLETSAVNVPANQDVGYDNDATRKRCYEEREAYLDDSLDELVEQDLLPESLVREFKRSMPMSPLDADRRAKAAVRGSVAVPSSVEIIDEAPDGAEALESIATPEVKESAPLIVTVSTVPGESVLSEEVAAAFTKAVRESLDGSATVKTPTEDNATDSEFTVINWRDFFRAAHTADPVETMEQLSAILDEVIDTETETEESPEEYGAEFYELARDAFQSLSEATSSLGDVLDYVEIPQERFAKPERSVLLGLRRLRGELDSLMLRATEAGKSGPDAGQDPGERESDNSGINSERGESLAKQLGSAFDASAKDFKLG